MKSSRNPKYRTLAQRFKRQIEEGKLQPGDRLPSFTQMRAEFGATPATVERLYALLERENLIERRHRSGVFVTDKLSRQKLQGTIGFVMLGFANSCLHPYNLLLLQGIQQAASAANVQVLLLDHSDIAANLNKMDGLLIYEHGLDKFLRYAKSCVFWNGINLFRNTYSEGANVHELFIYLCKWFCIVAVLKSIKCDVLK